MGRAENERKSLQGTIEGIGAYIAFTRVFPLAEVASTIPATANALEITAQRSHAQLGETAEFRDQIAELQFLGLELSNLLADWNIAQYERSDGSAYMLFKPTPEKTVAVPQLDQKEIRVVITADSAQSGGEVWKDDPDDKAHLVGSRLTVFFGSPETDKGSTPGTMLLITVLPDGRTKVTPYNSSYASIVRGAPEEAYTVAYLSERPEASLIGLEMLLKGKLHLQV